MKRILRWMGFHIHEWEWLPLEWNESTFQKRRCKTCGKIEEKCTLW